MNNIKTATFGEVIRNKRIENGLPLRRVAAFLNIDQAVLSKIERDLRKASRNQVLKFAEFFDMDRENLIAVWLSDKIVYELEAEDNPVKALRIAEEKIAYRTSRKPNRAFMIKKIQSVLKTFPAIEKAWIFGSYSRHEDTPQSDIDVLIDVPEKNRFTLFDIAEVKEELSASLNRRVDVVMLRALRPQVAETVKQDQKLIYEIGETNKSGKD